MKGSPGRRERRRYIKGQRAFQPTASSVAKGRSLNPVLAAEASANIKKVNPHNLSTKSRERAEAKSQLFLITERRLRC